MMFLASEQVTKYIRGYGAERILFGTDFPLWNPQEEVCRFNRLNLTAAEYEKIAFQNALGILKDL